MIEASFNSGVSRATAISGAYQYDTGQRLRLHGLPSPEEFSGEDDFLSGDLAAVEVHYSRVGDSQSEMRLAIYNEARGVWLAEVPDDYLTRSEEVRVHVYVSHGATDSASRARTMYEGVFTPISRAAPSNIATPEQFEEWAVMLTEIDLAVAAAQTAQTNALSKVEQTNEAAQAAAEPTQEAHQAASLAEAALAALSAEGAQWAKAKVSVTTLAAGSNATVSLGEEDGAYRFAFGIPRGAQGAPGAKGDTGPADVTFVLDGTTLYTTTT